MTYRFKLSRRLASLPTLASLLMLALSACNEPQQIAGFTPPPDTTAVRLEVAPRLDTTQVSQTLQLSAKAYNADGDQVPVSADWSASGGSVDEAGRFFATSPGHYRVHAWHHHDQSISDSATIVVVPGPVVLLSVVVAPSTVTLVAGSAQQFGAGGTWSDGSQSSPAVSWSATGGSITSSGLFTAGSAAGAFRVIATQQGGSKADTATVNVTVPVATLQSLSLSPSSVTLLAGTSRQYAVSGTWSDGSNTTPSVTYSATGGSIGVGGLYTAGTSAGTFRVIAAQQGGTLADTASVTVTVPVVILTSLTLTPNAVALTPGGARQFLVSGVWSDGSTTAPAVNWTATGGTVSGGLYTAGGSAGTFRVIATQQGGARADTAVITITIPVATLTSLTLTPSSASLSTGGTRQFAVAGTWSDGSTTTPAVAFSATGGTINSGGLYSAGSSAGAFRIIAVQQGGSLADTSTITLTVPAPTLTSLTLTPVSASLLAGDTRQFLVAGSWSDGSTTPPAVTLSATGGTITSGGLYTAGGSAGTFRVIAMQQGGSLADTSSVTVTLPPPTLVSLSLTPASASLTAGTTRQFSTAGTWSDGGTTPPTVTYSATGGTITTGGLYTAGSSAGIFRVIAVQQGGSLADTSGITVTVPAPTLMSLSLTPASASLMAGATRQFAVAGTWSDGGTTPPTVTYSATGGTITSGGLYTTGGTAGSFRVIAIQQGGTKADTSTVTVTVPTPTLATLTLSPSSTSVSTGATRQFAVSGTWSDGGTSAPAVAYSATGGTITGGGLYTAGSSAGSFRVIAVQQGGTLADTSAVTVTGSGAFLPPDLLNKNFDNGDFSWVSNFPGGAPRHRISTTGGVNGSEALEAFWAPNDADYSPADFPYASGSHRFVRLYFKLTTKMLHSSSNVKVFRFTNPNRGGIFSNPSQSWGFGFDNEAQSVTAALGIFEGAPTAGFLSSVGAQYVTASNIAGDGKYHWIEIDYDRNAPGGLVEARVWFDGTPVVMPTSGSGGAYANDGYFMTGFGWKGGVAGQTPSTLYATRVAGSPTETSSFGPIEEYSGGIQSTGSMFIDNVAVSTTRIGP